MATTTDELARQAAREYAETRVSCEAVIGLKEAKVIAEEAFMEGVDWHERSCRMPIGWDADVETQCNVCGEDY